MYIKRSRKSNAAGDQYQWPNALELINNVLFQQYIEAPDDSLVIQECKPVIKMNAPFHCVEKNESNCVKLSVTLKNKRS